MLKSLRHGPIGILNHNSSQFSFGPLFLLNKIHFLKINRYCLRFYLLFVPTKLNVQIILSTWSLTKVKFKVIFYIFLIREICFFDAVIHSFCLHFYYTLYNHYYKKISHFIFLTNLLNIYTDQIFLKKIYK